ncbi:MAG: flavodoxin domain-containing protein [Bacteroidales bacterium]|nr:flavodoxin domain-containing protein [Bacteroidales bacterium]MCF8388210.1 flavodoxin domain-containing protein [Bacteroidales bacterium]MCF8399619.1 flavodoxin domain-containing protein [Bacteroidales bacterium]
MQNSDNTLYILHGSRTGNSKSAAVLAQEYAEYLGLQAECFSMQEFDHDKLKEVKNLMIAVSTHGEGDPPVQAEDLYEYVHNKSLDMKHVNYSVLALGDSSYKHFCKTGKDFDQRLAELGGNKVIETGECDIDFEENAKSWVRNAVDEFTNILPSSENNKKKKDFIFELKLDDNQYNNAYNARILEKKILNQEGSTKRTMHIRLSLQNSDFTFEPGDSFGIYCTNSRLLVDRIIKQLKFDPTYKIENKGKKSMLKEALVSDYELTVLTPVVVEKYAELINNKDLNELVSDKKKVEEYAETRNIYDLISDFPDEIEVEAFLSILRKLDARLYSVANSRIISADEVDLTVGIIEYEQDERFHEGVSSSFLLSRVEEGEKVPVYLEPNERFRLPENPETPIVMISTGTGIAPFRAFLQERKQKKAKGRNWLFFGDRNEKTDFLYRDEINEFKNKGILTRLNAVFSRDHERKKYIHHDMLANSKELFKWIEEGAHVYICGNKRTMAKDARKALRKIIQDEGKLSAKEARTYFEKMKSRRQFQEDVY